MSTIETLETDGVNKNHDAEVLEHELEASAETGLSKAQLIEIFNPNKLENIIDNQAAEIHDLEKDIERLAKEAKELALEEVKNAKTPEEVKKAKETLDNKIALLVALKALKIEKIQKWSAIQDSVKAGNVTEESLDNEIARINSLNDEIQERVDQIKAETK
jgi:hypothetical protein